MITNKYKKSVANLIDDCIQACPIDNKRTLYKNIVLSGGTTTFTNFEKRLRKDLKKITNKRTE